VNGQRLKGYVADQHHGERIEMHLSDQTPSAT
jgi:hypothetical protein